jgi:hypothetical protein
MNSTHLMVMLAGAVDPSPLQRELDMPLLCLPLGRRGTLLDAWLEVMTRSPGCAAVSIVLNTPSDAEIVRNLADAYCAARPSGPPVSVMAEPAHWRGAAGLIRDMSWNTSFHSVVAVEAHCLPPRSLEPLLKAFHGPTSGVVGSGPKAEPTGLYVFDRAALAIVPPDGYFDLKEQLLPALYRAGRSVRYVEVTDRVLRLRDRAGYLLALRASLGGNWIRRSETATVSRQARLCGACVIEPGAVVEDRAVVHDSIVLEGAVVGAGTVMSRSLVLPHATVPAGSRVMERVVGAGNGSRRRAARATALRRGWPQVMASSMSNRAREEERIWAPGPVSALLALTGLARWTNRLPLERKAG